MYKMYSITIIKLSRCLILCPVNDFDKLQEITDYITIIRVDFFPHSQISQ
jgi:hypothetical protein